MTTKNLQDSHLAGLIKTLPVKQRRTRKGNVHNEDDSTEEQERNMKFFHSVSFFYHIRSKTVNSDHFSDVKVCRNAFLSLHGISRARLRRIQDSLAQTSSAPVDKRGSHENRPNKIPIEVEHLIQQHIKSFPARQSHYSLRKNPHKYYLPETLTIKIMYRLFLEQYKINVSYKVYWKVFTTKFNIKFGLPRTDTCTFCDTIGQKIEANQDKEIGKNLQVEKEIHLRKAEAFYALKRKWKQDSRLNKATVISFDYMQNLPLPHIRTNTVFYARQLWYYVFGIHDLSDDSASMYVYDESIGKKGQNDVTSHLFHFLRHLNNTTDTLIIFSDGCAGQNKNYTMVRFLYFIVHVLKIFQTVMHIFPVRGHSFLPNDQDFSIISKIKAKATVELPGEWDDIINKSRSKPSPFKVVNVNQSNLYNVEKAVSPYFLKVPKPPLKLKSIRMYKVSREDPGFIFTKDSYSGAWTKSMVRNKSKLPNELALTPLYLRPLKINPLKVKCLLDLCPMLTKKQNTAFYESFASNKNEDSARQSDVESEDNSSGCEDT